jgi:DNA repair exonuclease SbcCD ATPase subunit
MLKSLRMENVGPSARMEAEFGRRLNVITGDNGLGKSFLLDMAWWVMTRNWPGESNGQVNSGFMARPRNGAEGRVTAEVWGRGSGNATKINSIFSREH